MKAVIVDLLNGQAAALCDDGRVIRLPDAGYALGQIVEVHGRKRPARRWMRTISAVAAAAVLLLAVGGGAAYAMPYGVVSLDVNPSIEYTINRFDYVLSVEGVNEDGRALLAEMDSSKLVHRRIEDALEASVAQLEAGDWSESDEILISAGTKTEAHAEKLLSELEAGLLSRRENLQIHALTVSEEEISEAHREGMSAGRRRVLRELGEREGASFDAENWADRPIGEILRELDPERGMWEGAGHAAPNAGEPEPDVVRPQQDQRRDDDGQNLRAPEAESGRPKEDGQTPDAKPFGNGSLRESSGQPERDGAPFGDGGPADGNMPNGRPAGGDMPNGGGQPFGTPPGGGPMKG